MSGLLFRAIFVRMRAINKITTLFLILFLLLSLSGIKMNFHICGHSNHLYADVHISNNNNEDKSCELSHTGNKFCDNCIEKCCDEESECDDCSDIVKEVETDFELYTGVENLTSYRQEEAIIDAKNPFGEHFDASMI